MKLTLNPNDLEDYRRFILAKSLPRFRCVGREIEFPDEYASLLGLSPPPRELQIAEYEPIQGAFDYQADIARLAIRKRKFAVFMECGYGKDLIMKEYGRHVSTVLPKHKKILFLSPLMVIEQALEETERWYGKTFPIEHVKSKNLNDWLAGSGSRVGICNYEALSDDTQQGVLGALICDESSIMKSAYGKWGSVCLRLGEGLDYKLALTGTPAPNDRIEFANHAVFLDAFPTVNSFLAKYFVNKGQTQERWVLKAHALDSFYRDLSHWCIFVQNPGTYGWKDNAQGVPPIEINIHDIDLTAEQQSAVYDLTGKLFLDSPGGITKRAKLSQIGKGYFNGKEIASNKPAFIKNLVESWPGESTIIWCHFNAEQEAMERLFPDAVSISGNTPHDQRVEMIRAFQRGEKKRLISKGKIMQFGLNMQICTQMVFNSMHDSWEEFHQCVKRANRVGSTKKLRVHLPVSEVERPMMETVLAKAHRIEEDTKAQERTFISNGLLQWGRT